MKCTKETFRRALRTFLQAALSYLLVSVSAQDFTSGETAAKSLLTGLCISSCAAGLAAVMNLETEGNDDIPGIC